MELVIKKASEIIGAVNGEWAAVGGFLLAGAATAFVSLPVSLLFAGGGLVVAHKKMSDEAYQKRLCTVLAYASFTLVLSIIYASACNSSSECRSFVGDLVVGGAFVSAVVAVGATVCGR